MRHSGITLSWCTLKNNTALHGAGVSSRNSNQMVGMEECKLWNNNAVDPSNLDSLPSTGGGIHTSNSSRVQLHRIDFIDNTAVRGGGLAVEQHAEVTV